MIMDFQKGWKAFLQWKGWKITAAACVKGWNAALSWKGWQMLFCIPFPLVLVFCAGCGAGLVWVFFNGKEAWWPAYFLYALSAYSLTVLCVKLPTAVRGGKRWLERHPKEASLLQDEELHFKLELYVEQFINFAYGIFKIVSGVVIGSAWIGCDGIYNFTQALIQLYQILRRRKISDRIQQWKSYRLCGWMMLLLHLTLTGIVFQMVNWNRAEEQGEIMVIATALFAFYKIISSVVDIARDRKHLHPIDSSIRMLDLAQAIFAIFSLQASMFHAFGTGESWEHVMNLLTGSAVCLLIASTGIYMIRRANREIKKLQESHHG